MNKSVVLLPLVAMSACAAAAPPVPSLSPAKEQEQTAQAVEEVEAALDGAAEEVAVSLGQHDYTIEGDRRQGGLMIGSTVPGSTVKLDSIDVIVDDEGRFLFGFNRDHDADARLTITFPDGETRTENLTIAPFAWKESRIQVEESKANPFRQEDLDKIAEDRKLKDDARATMGDTVHWDSGFMWPAEGCISSPFGYRRIVNGTPRRFHSGVDVAAPDGMSPTAYIGTPIYAPADGRITLANADMFFEGGLVFIDHGQGLESALMHMNEVKIKTGDFVEQGDLIGTVGMTGRVTGPHLHWSLKWKDRLLDASLTVEERARCTPGL